MRYLKFNGVIAEVIEQYPNIDVTEFLMDKLEIPEFKAEELAARIKQKYLSETAEETKKSLEKPVDEEKSSDSEVSLKTCSYSVDSLSEKEFEHFIKWLLEELGYEVHPTKHAGVDFVANKDGEKIAIQAKKYLKNMKVPRSIILKTEQAKQAHECVKAIVISPGYFSQQSLAKAEKLSVELWNKDTLSEKIVEVRKKANLDEQSCFPKYKGSLLQSLLGLEQTKDFIIEPRTDEKYDLYLPGVKYPLLTFQACFGAVTRCVFRIKYNEPVGEFDGEALIKSDHGTRIGPDDVEAYELIIKYLEQIVE